MKRSAKFSVGLAVLALVSTGCGGGSDKDAKASATPSSAATPAVSAAVLKTALLVVSDFPTGWRSTPVSEDDDSKAAGDCGDRLKVFDKAHADSETKAEADFEKDSDQVGEELHSFADLADLQSQISEFTNIVRGCSKLIIDTGDEKVTLQVGELSFPKIGDDSFGLAATGKISDVPVELNYVLIRRGTVLMQLRQSGVFDADIELLTDLATKALAKLDKAVPPTP